MPNPALHVRAAEPSVEGDRIDYGAWLLPPQPPTATDRIVRHCSTAAGPIAFVAALALFVRHLV